MLKNWESQVLLTRRPGFLNRVLTRRGSLATAGIKMTTASPIAIDPLLDRNVTTKTREQVLYQSSGAIVAAIVVGIIVIFTVILLLLKMYNRHMRTQRELEPKNPKNTVPSTLDHNSQVTSHTVPATLTPVDIHMQNRRP